MRISTKQTTRQKESITKQHVKRYLQFKGYAVWRIQQGQFSEPGISDLIALKAGRCLFIEIKRPTTNPTKPQMAFRDEVERHGGIYIIIRSLQEIIDYVERGEI